MPNDKCQKYDLEERTAKFAEEIIDFVKTIKENAINNRIISQLVGAAGSMGANYCEATEAESKKDFEHKLGICKKESKETRHWFRMIAKAVPELKNESRKYWKEANELNLIFFSIVNKSRKKK